MEGLTWAFAESEYINLLFRSGLVSLMAHLGWVGIMLAWLRREIRVNHDTARKLAVFMFVMLITLSIMAFTNAVFTYSGTIDYLWIVLGLFVNMRENKTHEQA
jgi:predicted membrane channel-forming protein YqfA (hemolysin III family)